MLKEVTLFAVLAAMVAQSPVGTQGAHEQSVHIKLDAMNGSGETGIATLTPKNDKTEIVVVMTPASKDPQPAHFHEGTCEKYAPKPKYQLNSIVDGKSMTLVDARIAKLANGEMVINVHKSLAEIATISSCAVAK
jgi:Cu/Zn superoxide dismutase